MNDKERKAMFRKIQKPHYVMGIKEPSREQQAMTKGMYGGYGTTKHTGTTCHNCKGNDATFKRVITRGGGKITTSHCVRCNLRV